MAPVISQAQEQDFGAEVEIFPDDPGGGPPATPDNIQVNTSNDNVQVNTSNDKVQVGL